MSALANGYHSVPPGKLAAAVISLEMREPAALRPEVAGHWSLRRETKPEAGWYKELFARLGREWLWFSRLAMRESELLAIIQDPRVAVHALEASARDEGILELDFREPGNCEIAFFAVSESLRGKGAGRWLMNRAIELAWKNPISRVWLHTCTYDHPSALAFYQRSGFKPYKRLIEIADDPRLTGILPRDAAPHVPIVGFPGDCRDLK